MWLWSACLTAGTLLALAGPRCVPGQRPGKRPGSPGATRSGQGAPGDAGVSPNAKTAEALRRRLAPLRAARRVHLVSLGGPADGRAVDRVVRALRAVTPADGVVLELDSVGGEPAAVARLVEVLQKRSSPTVAFVKGQALGEAALLPLACDVVALAPGARWGAVGAAQFSGRRLGGKERAKLAAAFRAGAASARRSEAWAAAMVLAPPVRGTRPSARPEPGARPAGKTTPQARAAARTPAPRAATSTAGKTAPQARAAARTPAPRPAAGTPDKTAPQAGRLVQLDARRAVWTGLADLRAGDLAALLRHVGWGDRELLRRGARVALPGLGKRGASKRRPAVDPRKLGAGRKRVVVITIHGTIELGLRSFVLRVLRQARPTDLVVLDIDTFGGRVDAATEMRDALLRTKAKTVAFVNPRAISAGALLTLACDLIAMVPGGSFGAATPIQLGAGGTAKPVGEKMVSYMRKEFKTTAEAKGRRGDLAEAMVDMDVEVENVDPALKEHTSGLGKGKLLTLTTREALALRMAELRVTSFDALRNRLGVRDLPVIRPSVNWAEKISRFLTGPIVSGLLMTIGVLGLLLELYTPGFGLAGGVGISFLLLFFFGHQIAGLAGWEPMLLFGLGLVLLAVEIFVTPGFGVVGSLGVLSVVGSLFWTLLGAGDVPLHVSWEAGYVTAALVRVFLAVIAVFVLMVIALRIIPRGKGPFHRLVLSESIQATATDGAHALPEGVELVEELVGREGVVETPLHPTGKIRLGGRRLEAVSQGDFIDRGAQVRIVSASGRRIEVKEIPS